MGICAEDFFKKEIFVSVKLIHQLDLLTVYSVSHPNMYLMYITPFSPHDLPLRQLTERL